MDAERFERATALREAGRTEDALREFRSLSADTVDPHEKAAVLICETRCCADLGRLGEAKFILQRIRDLGLDASELHLLVEFMKASVAALEGNHEEAVPRFESALKIYAGLLQPDEYRDIYEEIQARKACSLVNLQKHQEAILILQDACSFSTLGSDARQSVHLYLGTCYAELHERQLAREQFLLVIEFNFKNGAEADARYRLGVVCFQDGGFAQSKHQLEWILREYPNEIPNVSRKYVYQQLSSACRYLGEKENARRYAKLARDSTS